MDGLWKHYAKLNKPDREGKRLYDSTSVKQRLPRARTRENEELLFNGYRVYIEIMRKFWV